MFSIRCYQDADTCDQIGPFRSRSAAEDWLTNLEDTFPPVYDNFDWEIEELHTPGMYLRGLATVMPS